MTEHSDSKIKYSEDDIIKMLEFLVDNIFVVLPEKSSSRHAVGIPLGTNCVPLLANIFLYSTVFALNGKETFSVSVQSHLQVHR